MIPRFRYAQLRVAPKKKSPDFSGDFQKNNELVLRFLKLENHVLAEFLVVLAEFEFLTCGEVLFLNVGDVTHDSGLSRDARHVRALTLCHT